MVKRKKLELRTERIRSLTHTDLEQIAGGAPDTDRQCSSASGFSGCCGLTQNHVSTCFHAACNGTANCPTSNSQYC